VHGLGWDVQEEGKCGLHDNCDDTSVLLRVRNGDIVQYVSFLLNIRQTIDSPHTCEWTNDYYVVIVEVVYWPI
jgi:hypothetical protein